MVQQMQAQDPIPQAGDWERLSALLDGELEADEAQPVLDAAHRDPAARDRWSEYCLIGDVLRGELQVQRHLRQGLDAALETEPTVLAPVRKRAARPAYWFAAAAAVGAITWTLWTAAPRDIQPLPTAQPGGATTLAQERLQPYLAAHQDYAQVVVATPDMRFTPVSLEVSEVRR